MTKTVLLVEDNEADIFLAQEVLEDIGSDIDLVVAYNGIEAIDFLEHQEKPNLIILDLNMPKMDGREFLKYVRGHENFKHIPVIVLTTSESKKDIISSYSFHANSYIVKPIDLDDFYDLLKDLSTLWFEKLQLPGGVT